MLRFLVTAMQSNSGKTAVTCGLLALARRKGLNPGAFKCGPDYIDPMFHRSVLGVESHNIDIFLSSEECAIAMHQRYAEGHDALICEGVMGYYDGAGVGTEASSYHVSKVLNMPAILVVRPRGSSMSLAAMIKGMKEFRDDSMIAAVLLNDCSEMMYLMYKDMIEKETDIPVIGYMPYMEEATFENRHLGLLTAGEIENLSGRIEGIADVMNETVDFERLQRICESYAMPETADSHPAGKRPESCSVNIAVARDEAFCFVYEETLDVLRDCGAKLTFVSPLHDRKLPDDIDAVYIPGGYPELYLERLQSNGLMRESIRSAIAGGMPCIAECGGFLYLGRTLSDEKGEPYGMVGALPGDGTKQGRLVRFGYSILKAKNDSLLLDKGEEMPVHEFHYWDSSANGEAYTASKKGRNRSWQCCYATDSLYAGFPHLYLAGNTKAAERFIKAAYEYRRKQC